MAKLRGVIGTVESKLEETTHTYEQKIKYLKQEIEMKKLQIESMRKLIEYQKVTGVNDSQGAEFQYEERKSAFSSTQPLTANLNDARRYPNNNPFDSKASEGTSIGGGGTMKTRNLGLINKYGSNGGINQGSGFSF